MRLRHLKNVFLKLFSVPARLTKKGGERMLRILYLSMSIIAVPDDLGRCVIMAVKRAEAEDADADDEREE